MNRPALIPLRFQQRLVVSVTLATILTLGGGLFIVGRAVNASQQGQLDEALVAEARQEASEAAALGGSQLDVSDRPGPAADDIGHLTKYAAIYRDHHLVAATSTFRGRPPAFEDILHPLSQCFDAYLRREHVRAVIVPIPNHPDAVLLLGAPRFDLDRDAAFLGRATLLVLAASALWAAFVVIWIVRRFTRGHQAVVSVARQVAAGDFSARVSEATSDPEMVQLARDVNSMIDRLSALLSSQQDFIAHAAHELRSPLTLLYGELSFALRRPRDDKSYRELIEEALDSARRLKKMAEDLLTLARVGAAPDVGRPDVSTRKIVEESIRTVAAEAASREVDLRVDGDSRAITGRPNELERLFRNLFENAVRHSPRGGAVAATIRDANEGVIVSISDDGPGIEESDRERVFEPFYRGPRESAEDLPGAGLGLAIARTIARSHGGDITLDVSSRRGAQFLVRLAAQST
jgi:two-component system heavy metal sensor histidine kinase CusS